MQKTKTYTIVAALTSIERKSSRVFFSIPQHCQPFIRTMKTKTMSHNLMKDENFLLHRFGKRLIFLFHSTKKMSGAVVWVCFGKDIT